LAVLAAPVPKKVPQTERSRFDEFLELERRASDFSTVWDPAQSRPIPEMGPLMAFLKKA
jgi:hypothetical protein